MNYTENYRLPQWVKSDRVLMEDFNEAMASIEAGLKANAAAASAAKSAAQSAQATASSAQTAAQSAQSAASSAQAKADSAQSAASSAQSAAQEAAAAKPFAAGTYTGTGKTLFLTVGFRPSFVIVSGMQSSRSADSIEEFVRYFAMTGFYNTSTVSNRIQLTGDGFLVYGSPNSGTYAPILSEEGRIYEYIAFK